MNDLDSQWNYLYFGYSKEKAKAYAYVYFPASDVQNELSWAPVTHAQKDKLYFNLGRCGDSGFQVNGHFQYVFVNT